MFKIFCLSRFWIFALSASILLLSSGLQAQVVFYKSESQGTGWAVSPQHIVTNVHVLNGLSDVMLVGYDQSILYGNVISVDHTNDIALIKITSDKANRGFLKLANRSARVGEEVFTIGYPFAQIMGSTPKMTRGSISALTGLADDPRMYQISVPLQPGNSGGPLINMKGELIGVTTAKLSAAKMVKYTGSLPENVNYAVKANYVRPLLDAVNIYLDDFQSLQPKLGGSFPDLIAKIQKSVFIVYPGEYRQQPVASVGSQSSEQASLPVKRFKKQVDLSYWDGRWAGIRDEGLTGDCASMSEQYIHAKIVNGKVRIKQYSSSTSFIYSINMESDGARILKGSIDGKGDIVVDRGDDYLGFNYSYKGYFEGEKIVGTWKHQDCEGHWHLNKK